VAALSVAWVVSNSVEGGSSDSSRSSRSSSSGSSSSCSWLLDGMFSFGQVLVRI